MRNLTRIFLEKILLISWICAGICVSASWVGAEEAATNSVMEVPPVEQARLQREAQARRVEYGRILQKWLPPVDSFSLWQARSGELPPDFQELRLELEKFPPQLEDPDFSLPTPLIPDPLRGLLVTPQVATDILLKIWNKRRSEILGIYTWWVLGSSPPAPKEVIPEVFPAKAEHLRSFTQKGVLKMGEDVKAELNLEMLFPKVTEAKLFPVLVLPCEKDGTVNASVHELSQASVARGMIVCRYWPGVGLDRKTPLEPGTGTNSVQVLAQWARADWGELCREAWMMRRVVDYLVTFPQVDKSKIALAGEGFYAKAAITAAAADLRVSATVVFSPGMAGFTPFRALSEVQMGAGIEGLTREHPEWVSPRLRFFSGRENYLPFEQTDVVACIIPRALYVATLRNDPSESLWANEWALHVLQRTYQRMGGLPQKIFLEAVEGSEFSRKNREDALDWLEYQWGLSSEIPIQKTFYPHYEQWLASPAGARERVNPLSFPEKSEEDILSFPSGNPITTAENWNARRREMIEQINSVLGVTPPLIMSEPLFENEPLPTAALLRRASAPPTLLKGGILLSNGVHVDFYFEEGGDTGGKKLPIVILQPGFSVPGGYTCSELRGEPPYFELAHAGFLVVVFDAIGCGTRIDEARHFYTRYPRWSLLGKMIQDISLAVDGARKVPFADSKKVYLVGYDVGGMASLYTAAMDPAITGVVTVGGFAPMRLNAAKLHTGGVARWTLYPLLLPKLGAFQENETRIPYDYNELMGLVAPRFLCAIGFKEDSLSNYDNLCRSMDSASRVYSLLGKSSQFSFEVWDDYNHYTPALNRRVIQALQKHLSTPKDKTSPKPALLQR